MPRHYMVVKFDPTSSKRGSGITSFASWDNTDVGKAMESLFGIKSNEWIKQIEVSPEGITARIERDYDKPTDRKQCG